ncbi:LysR family transcriptional regulator [Sphingopyxis sp. DBS4]|uniref:LysR family transcriptional regulator n=1 Tax=Sphingopyxis sp. DBS4 TaxID=2968500 RepID=UPI00214B962C|nr:LysR family transcriptional regulator [Sphingopyxis sp. DBS4]
MKLSHFDLNLLRSLDVLLAERNVTRAAAKLYVTQQAASGALQRLRQHFDDELLTRVGRRLELTPLARSLVVPVREALLAVQSALDTFPTFDPKDTMATCRIAMSDYALLVLLPRFLQLLGERAPQVKCIVEPLTKDSFDRLEMGDLDFCVAAHDVRLYGAHRPSSKIRSKEMFHDDFVCVVDPKRVDVSRGMSLSTYRSLRHNSAAFGTGVNSIVQRAWANSNFDFEIAVMAPSFSALLFMLPGTSLVATAQRRLANTIAPRLALAIVDCPLKLPDLQESLMWHDRSENDPVHIFLRETLQDAASELDRPCRAASESC